MDFPYFNLFPNDWLAVTGHLSYSEKGVYHELRCLLWTKGRECRLPGDDATLARLLGLSAREWARYRRVLLEGDFAVLSLDGQGRLYDRRLLDMYQKTTRKSIQAREAAEARWGYGAGNSEGGDADAYANAPTNADADAYPVADAQRMHAALPPRNANGHAPGNTIQNQSHNETQSQKDISNEQIPESERDTRTRTQEAPTPVPKEYPVNNRHLTWAHNLGWRGSLADLQEVADAMLGHHRTKRSYSFDWHEEFRKWMRREIKLYPPLEPMPDREPEEAAPPRVYVLKKQGAEAS